MQIDDLAKLIQSAHAEAVDKGIFFGVLTGRDVCVSTQGPFQAELMGRGEYPTFHGRLPYVRYEITRTIHASNGGVESRQP